MNAAGDARTAVTSMIDDHYAAVLAGDRARFDRHLAGCDGCTAYLHQMRVTIRALGHLPPESLSPEAESKLLEAFRGWSQPRP